jgi:hypothetical protein
MLRTGWVVVRLTTWVSPSLKPPPPCQIRRSVSAEMLDLAAKP